MHANHILIRHIARRDHHDDRVGDVNALAQRASGIGEPIEADARNAKPRRERLPARTSRTSSRASGKIARCSSSAPADAASLAEAVDGAHDGIAAPRNHSGPATLAVAIKKTRITSTTSTMGVMLGPSVVRVAASRRRSAVLMVAHPRAPRAGSTRPRPPAAHQARAEPRRRRANDRRGAAQPDPARRPRDPRPAA